MTAAFGWKAGLTGCLLAALGASGTAVAQSQPSPSATTAPTLEFVLEEIVTLGESIAPGTTSRGVRNIIPITGGTFTGPGQAGEGMKGEIMPGGWDWQLTRADGCREVVADYFLKTDDGVVINVRNTGSICPPNADGTPNPVRTHPVFEAPQGKYDWLNRTTFVGTLEGTTTATGRGVHIRFFRVR
ncbi:DUF3237 family protein [Altererythrobacter xixiisoli]|uniref:UPF0311 protein GRI97_08650 n=1 Tax=Croceibacterium xixiisoli TaxID=1476466 RepID=A0A6I4TSE4_9SPHN|nr:DUF3237 domain-containing protein [Croceibacterium xixiisoli]MXO99055.1 DUF3237 family protein [Croceibacterium xixiisoli]